MNNSTDKKTDGPGASQGGTNSDCTLAFLLLRGWLALRALLTGVEKFGAYKTIQQPLIDPATGQPDPNAVVDIKVKFYALANYNGIPAALQSKFAYESLLPHFATTIFNYVLGPAFIITGLLLLVGFGTRFSLFVQGLIYIALTAGLILLGQNDGISWLGIHIGLVAFALMLAKHNKLALLKKW